jgi:hypothetical protein
MNLNKNQGVFKCHIKKVSGMWFKSAKQVSRDARDRFCPSLSKIDSLITTAI